jgi:hypothetical protein
MDLARASDQLDRLIERRVGERSAANELAEMYAESARRHRERKRRENGAAWYSHFSALADSLRQSAAEYERRAEQLLLEGGGDKWGA